ncbi:hypothetical protein ACFVZD_41160 [Streptomyces sp. NPDC058287]
MAVRSLLTGPIAVGQPVSRQIEATINRPGDLTFTAENLPPACGSTRTAG